MIDDDSPDMNTALMLDGNALAGEMQALFGRDMTTAVARCAGCAADTQMGALLAFVRGPGAVLRCPLCDTAVLRIVQTSVAYYIDTAGAAYMRLERLDR